jgi:hypothetical protein
MIAGQAATAVRIPKTIFVRVGGWGVCEEAGKVLASDQEIRSL